MGDQYSCAVREVFGPLMREPSWHAVLTDELQQPYVEELATFILKERMDSIPVYPSPDLVFQAFMRTPYDKVRVVILGQDPYHGPRQAHGLSFSIPSDMPLPPSLKNIFKEVQADMGGGVPTNGNLLPWAEQGVLLLNATLTVRCGEPMSHYKRGWERFTDAVLTALCRRADPIVFLFWGKSAQSKLLKIGDLSSSRFCILQAPHPSPLSAYQGFFGCRHFSKANEFLIQQGWAPIHWIL